MENQNEFTDEIKKSTFTSIYNSHYKKMYAYGIAIGFCEDVCKDAIQDVFCTIYHSNNKLKSVENIESYLLHCMKNRLFDIYNDEKKKHCICCEDNTKKIEENLFDEIIAKENNQLMKKEVDRLLKKLSPDHRKIILCRYNHNLNFDEIAVIMGMTPDAVKKQLYRSLKLMQKDCKLNSATCLYTLMNI